ncbi:MAG: HlyD family efflux transporter periplasmic adaptor subunit [Oculatellaceae cyanobacterium Prado106]|nr:HlyD family efflux transporter periplasmic adaptor subunit [Oculatellaceae cyanobacterium Prado106]
MTNPFNFDDDSPALYEVDSASPEVTELEALEPEILEDDWSRVTQESLNTLPQVWTRSLLYVLVGLMAIALPWAVLSKVDEVGTAPGRLEPKGRTVRLDAPVAGQVARIHIKEGAQVKIGEPLMEVESGAVLSELEQAQAKLEGHQEHLAQLELLKTQQQISARTLQQQHRAQATEQSELIAQTQEQLVADRGAIAAAQALLGKDQTKVDRFRNLEQQGVISGSQVEEAERTQIENNQRLQQSQAQYQQTQSVIQQQQSAYERILREGDLAISENEQQVQELQTQITDLQSQIAQTQKQIQALQDQWQKRILYAPVNGTIFQLPIQNPGAVVQPGTLIAQIAPQGAPMVLRVQMDSQEMGFLRVGLPVKVKFDAYPFQDYGIVPGQLVWISPDSKTLQEGQTQREVFELEVELEQLYIQAGNKRIQLSPGQTATAEVIIRQRRMIDFLIDPFKQMQKGGVNF